jgi:hypothetical protein
MQSVRHPVSYRIIDQPMARNPTQANKIITDQANAEMRRTAGSARMSCVLVTVVGERQRQASNPGPDSRFEVRCGQSLDGFQFRHDPSCCSA